MNKKLTIFALLAIVAFSTQSQNAFISLKNVRATGATDTVDNAPILVDISGNVVVSGNSKITATQYDATTASQLTTGINVWLNSFNVSSQKAFVTANATDASGNVYVTGGVRTSTTNGIDFFTIKYNSAGAIVWSSYYNGPNSTSDVGTGIVVEQGNGNVYVTGASEGTIAPGFVDYATIKYNSNGVQQWVSRYDFANGIDVPTAISLKQGRVIVSGSSGSSFTNWDFATVKYNKGNGNQMSSQRQSNVGNGQDQVSGIATDPAGNVYVTGSAWNNNTGNFDVQTQKLDTNLNVIWVQNFDVSGFDDAGINIALDDSLNVIVTGSSNYNVGNNKELIVLKYNNNGTLQWNVRKLPRGGSDAVGVRVKIKNENEIFIGANYTTNSNQDIALLRFNKYGVQNLETTYNGPLNSTDKFLDFVLDPVSNYLFVSGRTAAGGSLDSNITLTYQIDDFPMTIITYSDIPARTGNELVVSFQQGAITSSVINNTNIQHGILSEFLTPSAMSSLNSMFTSPVDAFPCYKVFPWMTMSDSISISRSGNTIKQRSHWNTLGVILPDGSQDTLISASFNSAYNVIEYSCFNLVGATTFTVNDPEYINGESASLISTSLIPNANINIGPAWDIHMGDPTVIAGVFDTGINQMHNDLAWIQPYAKVPNGWNYSAGGAGVSLIVGTSNDPRGHGSAIAGIITAANNDVYGPPSVAGGNFATLSSGIKLHDMKTAWTNTNSCGSSNNTTHLMNAIVQGATGSVHGFSHDIQNHSWTYGTFVNWPIFDALTTAFKNQAFMALASGNGDDINSPCNAYSFPRLYPDRWMACTGANDATGFKANFSECGTNLDIIAPGTKDLYQPLCRDNGCVVNDFMVYGNSCNEPITGTSFAAPHTAGVAGLMISYNKNTGGVPNVLDPEDIEEIMQLSATVVTVAPSNTTVPNGLAGYGRLNAGDAMQGIKFPDYQVKHYSATTSVSTAVLEYSNHATCLRSNFMGMPAGPVVVDRYKVTKIASHSIPSGYSFLAGWERDAASNMMGIQSGSSFFCGNLFNLPFNYMPQPTDITATITASSATLVGYVYGIHDPANLALIHWFPAANASLTGTADFEYTLYMEQIVGVEENALSEHAISVYPNPASDKVYFASNLRDLTKVRITVFNVIGQIVLSETQIDLLQPNYIDVSNLKNGIYFFNLTNGGKKIVKKVIINR